MAKSSNQAHRRQCGAKAKHSGQPCKLKPMANGRCKFHGGMATGPKTEEGKRRSAMRALKHGERSADATKRKRAEQSILKMVKERLDER